MGGIVRLPEGFKEFLSGFIYILLGIEGKLDK